MSPEIVNLIEQANSTQHEVAANAVTSMALMLERNTPARDSDANYAALLPDTLFRHSLSTEESQALIITLSEILRANRQLAGSAAWALGKTNSHEVIAELLAALARWREHNGHTVWNLLIAVENCGGLDRARGQVEEIANSADDVDCRELARGMLARRDAI